ncbi:transposase family protein, partial [Caldalkalibacillus thermarum]|uniref:transposase family protein n=1 Tax=Caldalkalibacillus thermarum TaxID=296745 RepID=UPI001663D3E3
MKTDIRLPLGLPEFTVLKQEITENKVVIQVETMDPPERCPYCGFQELKKHDQRLRRVRDLPIHNRPVYLIIQLKRWHCTNCQEIFDEHLPSVPKGKHQTHRFRKYVFDMCHGVTISYVSRQVHLPYKTVERIYYDLA